MSHNIYKESFYSLRVPAWHELGYVSDTPLSAVEAGLKVGLPEVYTEAIKTSSGLPIPDMKAIIGRDKDNTLNVFSIVSEGYREITHADFCKAWDEATDHTPVETVGLLGKGDTLFLTTKLPGFDIKGIEHKNFLLAVNPLTGTDAEYGRITPVRVVCQNTLNLSSQQFVEEFRAMHKGSGLENIVRWITGVWERAKMQSETLIEAYAILADRCATVEHESKILNAAYPDPEKPAFAPGNANLKQWADWKKEFDKQGGHRSAVSALFNGQGVGSDLSDVRGTLYGVYNAVCEYEQFGKPHGRASSAFTGAGAVRTGKAFDTALALARQ